MFINEDSYYTSNCESRPFNQTTCNPNQRFATLVQRSVNKEMQIEKLESIKSVAADTRGKHRVLAELKRLEQETRHLEEELDKFEKMEAASAVCKEILSNVETRPDPLLPMTHGPANPSWDQWFEGPQDEAGCRCWIL